MDVVAIDMDISAVGTGTLYVGQSRFRSQKEHECVVAFAYIISKRVALFESIFCLS